MCLHAVPACKTICVQVDTKRNGASERQSSNFDQNSFFLPAFTLKTLMKTRDRCVFPASEKSRLCCSLRFVWYQPERKLLYQGLSMCLHSFVCLESQTCISVSCAHPGLSVGVSAYACKRLRSCPCISVCLRVL